MKKLFLVDAYALIFKYYYAFLGRPMRNREGMNTSVVFGFVKFLRDIQKRERPDLLGVAFDPKGGSFRRDIFPEYKANRSETPEDILLSIPYVKRVLDAMCIPILEVAGYEADDVIGTLSQKGVEAGYDVYMVTPDKDYGQLVRDNCRIYKQRGAEGSIEIVDREAIREKYGIDDPQLVRDILALWGDASDNIPGVPGIGEKIACKLVREWGTVENILENVGKIPGKQGEKIAGWADNLRLAKRLTTICLDVPIPFREEDLTVCDPHIDQLRGIFAELDFKAFMNDLTNLAPAEPLPEGPRQEAQTQLAEMARAKSAAAKKAALAGQGNLFGDPVVPLPAAQEVPVAELQAEAEAIQFRTAQTTPHEYTLVETAAQLREVVAAVGRYPEFCFDTETTGFDIFNDRIVGLSLAVEPFKAWYVPFLEKDTPEYAEIVRPLFEDEKIAKIGQNIKFDLMVLRRLGITIRGRMYDTMILHYLLDPESRHNMNALAEKYLNYKPIEIETLIGKGSKQLTMDLVNVERVKEYAAEDADVTLQLKQALYPMIEQIGLQHLYFEIEEPMIAVLADIKEGGADVVEYHRQVGRAAAASQFNALFCYGDDARYIAEEARANAALDVHYFPTKAELIDALRVYIREQDLLLFKGSHSMELEDVVDKLFGTWYHEEFERYDFKTREFKTKDLAFRLYTDHAVVTKKLTTVADVEIPACVEELPVTGIERSVFSGSKYTESVTFPDTLTNIRYCAFYKTNKLKTVSTPPSVRIIDNSAFSTCENLRTVEIAEGCTHLGYRAFGNCKALEKITIPATVRQIGGECFLNCEKLTIHGKAGSYAQQYARGHGIPFCAE